MPIQLLPALHHKVAISSLFEHNVKFQNYSLDVFKAVSIILESGSGNHIENICGVGQSVCSELKINFDDFNIAEKIGFSTLVMNFESFKENSVHLSQEELENKISDFKFELLKFRDINSFRLEKWDLRQALNSIHLNTDSEKYASQHASLAHLNTLTELALIASKGGLNYAYSVLSAVDTDWMTFDNAYYLMSVGMGFIRERTGKHNEIAELGVSFRNVYESQIQTLKSYFKKYPKGDGNNCILNFIIKGLDAVKCDFVEITPRQYITAVSFAIAVGRSPNLENSLLKTAVESYHNYKPQAYIHINKQNNFIYNTLSELQIACTHFLTCLPGSGEEKNTLLNMSLDPIFQTAAEANLGTGNTKANHISSIYMSEENPDYYLERKDALGKVYARIKYT